MRQVELDDQAVGLAADGKQAEPVLYQSLALIGCRVLGKDDYWRWWKEEIGEGSCAGSSD